MEPRQNISGINPTSKLTTAPARHFSFPMFAGKSLVGLILCLLAWSFLLNHTITHMQIGGTFPESPSPQLEERKALSLHPISILTPYQAYQKNGNAYINLSRYPSGLEDKWVKTDAVNRATRDSIWFIPTLIVCLSSWLIIINLFFNDLRHRRALTRLNKDIEAVIQRCQPFLPATDKSSVNKLYDFDLALSEYFNKSVLFSTRDKLTQLQDRHSFLGHVERQLKIAQDEHTKKGLLFIDLDGFKQVNDSFGHSFGDDVLIQVGQRLNQVIRRFNLQFSVNTEMEANLCRLGGDEFAIFIENIKSSRWLATVAQAVVEDIKKDFNLGNKIVKIGASIGIATFPDSASTPQSLLQLADVAMYRAKKDGRGIYRVYSPEMGQSLRRYHYLLEELRLAIANQDFNLSFQPIVNTDNCNVDYFEALTRWPHKIEGFISPAEFIPIAEESNMILELGDWILEESIRQMKQWHTTGMRKARVSVNISGVQLKHRKIDSWIVAALEKYDLPPESLMIEITESCIVDFDADLIEKLENIRSIGVKVAIDDFGTGFSSLNTLAYLPVDIIKIDKVFIARAIEHPKYHKILTSITELGKELQLKIVAEGVELSEQLDCIRALNIHSIQGYLVGRPEPAQSVNKKVIKNNLNHIASTGTCVLDTLETVD